MSFPIHVNNISIISHQLHEFTISKYNSNSKVDTIEYILIIGIETMSIIYLAGQIVQENTIKNNI